MCSTSPSPVPPVRRGPGVVACAFYRDGQRVRVVAVEEIGGHAGHEGGIVWLGLHEPDEALLSTIQAELGLHELIVEDANQAHQRAKLNPYAGGDVRNWLRLHLGAIGTPASRQRQI